MKEMQFEHEAQCEGWCNLSSTLLKFVIILQMSLFRFANEIDRRREKR